MSPKLKRLSGKEVIGLLGRFGFDVESRKGSHVKLRRITSDGQRQTLTVPGHEELDVGTLHAIIRQASRYISEAELRAIFYSD